MLQAEAFITVSCAADFTPYGSFGGDVAFVAESSTTYTTPALTVLHFGIAPSGVANELDCFPVWVFVNSSATFTAYGSYGGAVNFITNTPEEGYEVTDLTKIDFPTLPEASSTIFNGLQLISAAFLGAQPVSIFVGSAKLL